MDTTFDFIRGVITLDEQTYRDFLTSENVMKRGFLIFLACFIIGTFPVFGQSLIANVRGFTPAEAEAFKDQFATMFVCERVPFRITATVIRTEQRELSVRAANWNGIALAPEPELV